MAWASTNNLEVGRLKYFPFHIAMDKSYLVYKFVCNFNDKLVKLPIIDKIFFICVMIFDVPSLFYKLLDWKGWYDPMSSCLLLRP